MSEIQQKLIKIFWAGLELEIKEEEVQGLTRANCPAWDSMGHLNVLLATEQTFQVAISDEIGASVASYWGLVELVERLTHGNRIQPA